MHKLSFIGCRRGGWLAASCAGALALWTGSAAAAEDEPNAAETAAARTIALEGIRLADAGRCEEAIEKLSRAEKLHHAPVVLGRLGECQVLEGKLVDGTETLRKVLREALPANASPALLKARERAQSVFDKARPRIAALHISVNGPAEGASVAVMVDGELMNSALLDADRPTDPGDHLIEASATGFLRGSARVSLGPGDQQQITIELAPDPHAISRADSVSPALDPERAPDAARATDAPSAGLDDADRAGGSAYASSLDGAPSAEPSYTGAYVAWAAGGVAVAAGSVFGLMAFNGKSNLDEQCSNNLCPATSRDQLDSARSASTAATVLFAVGGASLAVGTALFFIASPSEDGSVESSASNERAKLARSRAPAPPRAFIGIGHVGLAGEF